MNGPSSSKAFRPALVIAAIGVVFGDIGTSPLYTIIEVFAHSGPHALPPSRDVVVGIVSTILWSVIMVVTVKYLVVIMRADNDGEGGILALLALALRNTFGDPKRRKAIILAGLAGAALLYGDGVITPAISVLSAVEGTKVINPALSKWVVPAAVVILCGLFAVQRLGTGKIGRVFAPLMALWFVTIGVLGLSNIISNPAILAAANPFEAVQFFIHHGTAAWLSMGAVCLSITGGEALYADMGHFGWKHIRVAWLGLVLPALMLSYMGQGASLLSHPERADSPFFKAAPTWSLVPLVILATLATTIASQALISGAFSMTSQAVNLGYLPRMHIVHTSEGERGQIYVPTINAALFAGCIALVLVFRSSTNLAAAFGLAVTSTMGITTVLFYFVATKRFGWPRWIAGSICAVFIALDLLFVSANIPKIPHGGWVPLAICVGMMVLFTTWFTGRRLVRERLQGVQEPIPDFVAALPQRCEVRTPGLGIYLGPRTRTVPQGLVTHLHAARALPVDICIVNVVVADVPHVAPANCLERTDHGNGVTQLIVNRGFMDSVDLPTILEAHASELVGVDFEHGVYVLGRETLLVTERPGMVEWRERLFRTMMRNSETPDAYFNLPSDRTIELASRVEL